MNRRQQTRSAICPIGALLFLCLGLLPAAAAFGQLAPTASLKAEPVKPLADDVVDQKLDLIYARYGTRDMKLDLFRPKHAAEPLPAVVVVHGGGWLKGDKTRFRALAQTLAQRGYVTAAIEYRLGGEARFPAAVHDCNAAVRWLRANAKEHGIDDSRIAAVGGSAGGHLVGLVAAGSEVKELQGDGGNAEHSSRLQAAVVLAGPFQLASGPVAERSRNEPEQSNTNRWLGKTIDEVPELYKLASPYTHLSTNTPPLLFLHGELDHPDQNLASRQRLQELGIAADVLVYKSGRHGCWNQHPWFGPMVDDIDAFLTTTLKRRAKPEWQPRQTTAWGEIRFAAEGLELHVARRPPDGVVSIPRLNNPVVVAYASGDAAKTPLKLNPDLTEWSIELPPAASGDATRVIVVETVGRPYVPAIPRIVAAADDGSVTLGAHDAVTHGERLRYEPQPHKNTVGYWTNQEDWCEWHCYVERPGQYEIRILQGCGKGHGGSEVAVVIGGQELTFIIEDTGHFQTFKERTLGVITLPAPHVHTLQLRPRSKSAAAIMDVRQIRLLPVNQK